MADINRGEQQPAQEKIRLRDISAKIGELDELYAIQEYLLRQHDLLRARESLNRIENTVSRLLEGVNRRVAQAFEAKEANRLARQEYRTNLEDISNRYAEQISEIDTSLSELRSHRTQLLEAVLSEKAMVRLAKRNTRGHEGDFSERSSAQIEEYERIREAVRGAKEQIAEIDRKISDAEKAKEELAQKRDKDIEELSQTRDNKLIKQNIISRIVGLFGRGAQKRADAIAQSIVARNTAARDRKDQLELDFQENVASIEQTRKEIKQNVRDRLSQMRESFTRFGKNVVQLGERALNFATANFDLISLGTRAASQNIVRKVLEGLKKFSDPKAMEETQEKIEEAKQKRSQAIRGNNREETAEETREETGAEID